MGAELVDQSVSAVAVAERQQPLRQNLHTRRRAIVLGQFLEQQSRDPVGAEQLTHGGAGAGLGQNDLLTQTGPGTTMGQLFRPYWVPARVPQYLPQARASAPRAAARGQQHSP